MGDITKNFSWSEMSCKCGRCQGHPDSQEATDFFVQEVGWLQTIRDAYGKPIHINSGYRCPDYNDSHFSTGKNGPHTKGAFDVGIHGHDCWELVSIALKLGATGVGLDQRGDYSGRFVHLDRLSGKTRPWIWTY